MSKPVLLSDILDALSFVNEETEYYLEKESGVVHMVTSDDMFLAADESSLSDIPDWQKESVEITKKIINEEGEFLHLPDQFDLNEKSVMLDFAYLQKNEDHKKELLEALSQRRPYRRYKDTVIYLGIENEWYAFKDKRLKEFAIEWCKENEIEYKE